MLPSAIKRRFNRDIKKALYDMITDPEVCLSTFDYVEDTVPPSLVYLEKAWNRLVDIHDHHIKKHSSNEFFKIAVDWYALAFNGRYEELYQCIASSTPDDMMAAADLVHSGLPATTTAASTLAVGVEEEEDWAPIDEGMYNQI